MKINWIDLSLSLEEVGEDLDGYHPRKEWTHDLLKYGNDACTIWLWRKYNDDFMHIHTFTYLRVGLGVV